MSVSLLKVPPIKDGKTQKQGEDLKIRRKIFNWIDSWPFESQRVAIKMAYYMDPRTDIGLVSRLIHDPKMGIQGGPRKEMLRRFQQIDPKRK